MPISIRLSNDFEKLYVYTKDNNINLIDPDSMSVYHHFIVGIITMRDFCFSWSGELMVSTYQDGHWKLWK